MNPTTLHAFVDEVAKIAAEKIAKTRAAEEAAKALQAGDAATAEEIARGYRKLDLAPRHVKDISIGGSEAGVDLMMGVPRTADAGKLPSGSKDSSFVVRKLYKPDSRLHRGEGTRTVLQHKQEATDIARQHAPKHITAMGGFQEPSPGKFTSYHEYIPNLQTWDPKKQGGGHAESALDILENNLIRPMDRNEGYYLHDTVMRRGGRHTDSQRVVNPGNVAMIPGARGGYVPKVLDFLPYKGNEDPYLGPGMPGSAYGEAGDKTLDDLRKDVFSGKGGSRQPKKIRGAVEAVRKPAAPAGVLKRLGAFAAEHPLATGAAAVGTVGALGAGGYALHKHLKNKAENDVEAEVPKAASAFCDEMCHINNLDLQKVARPSLEQAGMGAAVGAGLGALGGALGAGEDRRLVGALQGAGVGALTAGSVGLAGPEALTIGGIPASLVAGNIAGGVGSVLHDKGKQRQASTTSWSTKRSETCPITHCP